jgi:hypothetical protein
VRAYRCLVVAMPKPHATSRQVQKIRDEDDYRGPRHRGIRRWWKPISRQSGPIAVVCRSPTVAGQQAKLRQTRYTNDMIAAYHAWNNRRLESLYTLLDSHRPQPGQTDSRRFEWHLLKSISKQPSFFLKMDEISGPGPEARVRQGSSTTSELTTWASIILSWGVPCGCWVVSEPF